MVQERLPSSSRFVQQRTAPEFTQKKMSALRHRTIFDEWSNFEPYMYYTGEQMSTLAQLDLPGSTSTSSPRGSVSSDTNTFHTPESTSSSSTSLQYTDLASIARHEAAGPEQQECLSEHWVHDYHPFVSPMQIATGNSGRTGVDNFLSDPTLGNFDPHLAGASSTSVQSGHGFSNLLADYPPNLFSEDCNAEEQPNLRDRFENDAHASYQPYFLGSELERHHYHHSTLQAPARPWESSGGLPAHGQTRIHNIPTSPATIRFRDTSNDSRSSFPPQLPTSGSSQVPAAYNLSAGPTYNVINERGSIEQYVTEKLKG